MNFLKIFSLFNNKVSSLIILLCNIFFKLTIPLCLLTLYNLLLIIFSVCFILFVFYHFHVIFLYSFLFVNHYFNCNTFPFSLDKFVLIFLLKFKIYFTLLISFIFTFKRNYFSFFSVYTYFLFKAEFP
jgi:hypothetical protein